MKKAVAIAWLSPILLAADTHYVRPPETCTNTYAQYPFTSWETASTNLQWAVNAAGTAGTVLVSNGVYRLTNNVVITDAIYVRSWVDGAFDPTNTVLDGQGSVACLYLNHTGAVVAGFAFTNGNGVGGNNSNYGGAVYIGSGVSSGGTLSNCIVAGNTAPQQGGGIYARGNYCLIVDCRVESNTVINAGDRGGGGISMYGGTVRGCLVRTNVILESSSIYTGGGGIASRDSVLIDDCVIENNFTVNMGGGVFATEQSVISNTVIRNNHSTGQTDSQGGGGLALRNCYSWVADCMIVDNHCASNGGGVLIYQGASGYFSTISNSTIRGNIAGRRGGGVNLSPGSPSYAVTNKIIACMIETNQSGDSGGGVFIGTGGILMDRCILRGNQASSEGGFRNMNASANFPTIIRNTLITGNSAAGNCGGARLRYGGIMQNCTVSSNYAGGSVGGLWLDGTNLTEGPVTLTNVICRYNFAGETEVNYTLSDGAVVAYSCTWPTNGLAGPGNIEADPLFVDTNAGNYRLQAGSPCINAGALQPAWMPDGLDLDGRPRLDRFSRAVDMGCHEHILSGMLLQIR